MRKLALFEIPVLAVDGVHLLLQEVVELLPAKELEEGRKKERKKEERMIRVGAAVMWNSRGGRSGSNL